MGSRPANRSKPWWRRLDGMPGDIPPEKFVEPVVLNLDESAMLQISREHRYADSRRPYNVWIDDQPVGELLDSDTFQVRLDHGRHRMRLTLGSSWSSPEVVMSLDPGVTVRFRCCNRFGLVPGVSLLLAFFLPFRWIRLWREDGLGG